MRLRTLVAVTSLVSSALLTGCAPDELKLRAAHDLQCASNKLTMTQVDETRTEAYGCGRRVSYFCGVDTRGMPVCKKEKVDPRAFVQEQAGQDLQCPSHTIEVDDDKETKGTFVAKACGRTGRYTCREALQGYRCQKVRGPGVVDDGAPPASASAASSAAAPATPATPVTPATPPAR